MERRLRRYGRVLWGLQRYVAAYWKGTGDGESVGIGVFNGGGIAMILTAEKAVTRMVRDDLGLRMWRGKWGFRVALEVGGREG